MDLEMEGHKEWEGEREGDWGWEGEREGEGEGNSKGKGIVEQTPGGDDLCCAVAFHLHKEMSEPELDTEAN